MVEISSNKLSAEDFAAHDWYRFVLAFPPHLIRLYLEKFGMGEGNVVLDPFCGTGTTLVECKKLGIHGVGVEAHPMTHFASSVKVDWSPSPDELLKHAGEVAEGARSELEALGFDDDQHYDPHSLFGGWEGEAASLRALPEESQKLLLKRSISPLPLHKTLVLLDHMKRSENACSGHERLALAKAVISSISNLRFGPEVGVGSPKPDAAVISSWLANVRKISDDLRKLQEIGDAPSVVHHNDSRRILRVLESDSVDAIITSPPYPNEKDYTRTTRLESVLLGFIRNKEELRALKRNLVRSNTRGVYKGDDDDRWISEHQEIRRIADAIEARRIELGKTSGFERLYARVTMLYFGGMARHLADLRRVLRPGAHLAYVVGDQASYLRVMIRTGQLLADIARSLDYEVVDIDLFRTRLATATGEQLREEVVVLRWPGERTKKNPR
ncbi:MAG: DNA methyltransferase [Rubrobacteraceae bacterium]